MHNKLISILFLAVIIGNNLQADIRNTEGQVIDLYTGEGIPGADIFGVDYGTSTDINGDYSLNLETEDTLTIRCIGYESQRYAATEIDEIIQLKPTILQGQSINVSSNRVLPGVSSVAYSILNKTEIRQRYSVEDVPMILSSEAGVHAYSESGNGTGYSYVSIRGFDQSRIAVMLDNVPLNDNESHQVYWVDHGDILSDAEDVEIQRGVGSSLYGASSFGGSININTGIKSNIEKFSLGVLAGSYNTRKYRFGYKSGLRFGENLSLSLRVSALDSDGYRVDSKSEQRSLMFGLEHRGAGFTNQFRAVLGKEFSVLQWDGVSQSYLDDPDLRREKMPWTTPFTDDFFQEIYSLNTQYYFNDHSALHNVVYLVRGSGFYEVQKYDQDFYSYNLDPSDAFPDSIEQQMVTDLQRRQWIKNNYIGITPVWTFESKKWRSDMGMELRRYTGDHYGEVMNIGDPDLAARLPGTYQYYSYQGQKHLITAFGHFLFRLTPKFSANIGLKAQRIFWQLNQDPIGHAQGLTLAADWTFLNPRIGLRYELREGLSLFAAFGSAQKEPADNQIIEADDVWSTPVTAPTEAVRNTEIGVVWFAGMHNLSINLYRIDYENELLSDIYDFQDGSFDVETANLTIHRGIELESNTQIMKQVSININSSIAEHTFARGPFDGKVLTNVPGILGNAHLNYKYSENLLAMLSLKYVGEQFIDFANSEEFLIPSYFLTALSLHLTLSEIEIQMKVNNMMDTQYATFGYEYDGGYYWPGANRNYTINLNYSF
ncbi:MAG: TonB-dependent receptor [Candidatus Marinimicrobia bacterium]|nr:TonB-dependent receptor [Candidatus Neomarinimicrobiota bacterium]